MRQKKIFSRKDTLSQYSERTYIERDRDLNIYSGSAKIIKNDIYEIPRREPRTRPKPPKPQPQPQPQPQPPPLTGCEFVSVGNFDIPSNNPLYPGVGAYLTPDPVLNSSTNILLKSKPDLDTMMVANVLNTAPHYLAHEIGTNTAPLTNLASLSQPPPWAGELNHIKGFAFGATSKWGDIITGQLWLRQFHPSFPTQAIITMMYVKFEVDPITQDLLFHSYYIPDPVNPPNHQINPHFNTPPNQWPCFCTGLCSTGPRKDIGHCSAGSGNAARGHIYEITYHPTTSTFTDTWLFDLPLHVVIMPGSMVYRPSDNTIFIMADDVQVFGGVGPGIMHYDYNGTLIDEIWDWHLDGHTMYCHDGQIYIVNSHEKIYRIDEPAVQGAGLSFVHIAHPPTFNFYNDAAPGDGATDSACCNPGLNPCLDPLNGWNQMPYGYQEAWYHDPNDINHHFLGQVLVPTTPVIGGIPTPPFAPVGPTQTPGTPPHNPIAPSGTPMNWAQLGAFINASAFNALSTPTNPVGVTQFSEMAPWTQTQPIYPHFPNPPYSHPSHVRMSNETANWDYENQSTLCEWCAGWGGGVGGPFPSQVTNWPLWIQNSWGIAEAEAMCQCCPAIDPGISAWPIPPIDPVTGLRGKWIFG